MRPLHALFTHVSHRGHSVMIFECGAKPAHTRAAGLGDTAKINRVLQMGTNELFGQPHVTTCGTAAPLQTFGIVVSLAKQQVLNKRFFLRVLPFAWRSVSRNLKPA